MVEIAGSNLRGPIVYRNSALPGPEVPVTAVRTAARQVHLPLMSRDTYLYEPLRSHVFKDVLFRDAETNLSVQLHHGSHLALFGSDAPSARLKEITCGSQAAKGLKRLASGGLEFDVENTSGNPNFKVSIGKTRLINPNARIINPSVACGRTGMEAMAITGMSVGFELALDGSRPRQLDGGFAGIRTEADLMVDGIHYLLVIPHDTENGGVIGAYPAEQQDDGEEHGPLSCFRFSKTEKGIQSDMWGEAAGQTSLTAALEGILNRLLA